jgi:hypothetical protein
MNWGADEIEEMAFGEMHLDTMHYGVGHPLLI